MADVKAVEESNRMAGFIHLPSVDNVGHANGWASAAQLAAIAQADTCIGRILSVLDAQNLTSSTFVLITSDHGGAGRSHGPDDPRSRHIPWIAFGPGISKNIDLTIYDSLNIDTEDTFATACYLLGIHIHKPVDGRPITQIVDWSDLLMDQ